MALSQIVVVSWIQSMLAAAILLFVAQRVVIRLNQPVDRIRLIQYTLCVVMLIPFAMLLSPWHVWRLRLVAPLEQKQIAPRAAVNEATTVVEPIGGVLPRIASQQPIDDLPDHEPLLDATSAVRPTVLPSATSVASPRPVVEAASPTDGLQSGNEPVWMIAATTICVVHGLALLYFLIEWALGAYWLRVLCRNALPPTVALAQTWDHLTQGRGKDVRLLVSTSIDAPLMSGCIRPIVMIPRRLADEGGTTLIFCLAHEWSHIERGDMLAWNYVRACQFLLWLQPSYWSLRTELRLQQDILADDRSTQAKRDAIEYSELLIGFARNRMSAPVSGALTFIDRPTQLLKRIKMLLENPISLRSNSTWTFTLVTAGFALLSLALITSVRLDSTLAEDTPPATQTSSESKETNKPASTTEKPAPSTDKPKAENAQPVVNEEKAPETLTYSCSVVDKETGKGIPGAKIVVRRSILTSVENRILEETQHTTDADGKYQFVIPPEQVAIGSLYIELDVEHDDYASKKGHGYALVMIRKNEKLGERPFFEKTELYPGEAVTGMVVSPDGKPLSGVKVQCYSMVGARNFNSSSFNDVKTDASGKFRLTLHKDVDGVIWVIPKNFAVIEKFLAKKRGDIGTIKLTAGVRTQGRVTSAEGKPLAGVAVNIDFEGDRDVGGLPVVTSVRRGAISNADGQFTFDPLPAGDYRVAPSDYLSDPLERDRTNYSIPGVFGIHKLTLKEGSEPKNIEIQAIPHIVFNAQIYGSTGKKRSGHSFTIFGQLDGNFWHTEARPDKEGKVEARLPHGLKEVQVQLSCNEHQALRYRRGKDQPLENRDVQGIEFGTLNDDVEGFEIIYYTAPVVLVAAVDEEQKPIKEFRVSATYPWGKQAYILEGETRSDISFERQGDGRYRTSQMLPDEDVTFTVTADGYESASEKVRLAVRGSKDLVLTLKKVVDKKTSSLPATDSRVVINDVLDIDKAAQASSEKPKDQKNQPAAKNDKALESLHYSCSVVDKETGKGIPGARVVVRRSIYSSVEKRILQETKHTTDAEGKYQFEIPSEQIANSKLYIELDVDHDNYAPKKGIGYGLAMSRKNELLGERPFFETIRLFPGETITGKIVSPDGKPVSGVKVQSYSMANRSNMGSGSFNDAKTDVRV